MGSIIATKPDEVSSAWIDYWSFGHLMFGAVAYFIIYAVIFYGIYPEYPLWFDTTLADVTHQAGLWGLIGATICGIVWEPIENIVFVKAEWKAKQDSWPNLIMDTILVFLGALLLYFIHIPLINLIICCGLVVLLIVCWYLTTHNASS